MWLNLILIVFIRIELHSAEHLYYLSSPYMIAIAIDIDSNKSNDEFSNRHELEPSLQRGIELELELSNRKRLQFSYRK